MSELIDELEGILTREKQSVEKALLDKSRRFNAEIVGIASESVTLVCDSSRFFEVGDTVAYVTGDSLKDLGTVTFVSDENLTVLTTTLPDAMEGKTIQILEIESLIAYDLQLDLLSKIKAREIPSDKEPVNIFLEKRPVEPLSKPAELKDRTDVTEGHELDESQVKAVEHALSLRDNEFLLVVGPPGTGKTRVIKKIALELMNRGEKVLITSHTNRAVDNAIEGLPLDSSLRVGRPEKVLPNLKKYLFSYKAEQGLGDRLRILESAIKISEEDKRTLLKNLRKQRDSIEASQAGALARPTEILDKIRSIEIELEQYYYERKEMLRTESERLVEEVPIIGSTLVKCQLYPMKNVFFDTVLIDESSQASISLALLAMVKGRKWVLVGDHKQLLPIFRSAGREEFQERLSAFNHLYTKYVQRSVWLRRHYRSNSKIIGFPQKYIYDSQIMPDLPRCDGIKLKITNYRLDQRSEILAPNKPVVFVHVDGFGVRSRGSLYNEGELDACSKIVDMLLKSGVESEDIGVITPYTAQKKRLMTNIKRVEVNTVDAFQGREKEVIIFSVAATSNLKFASNPNRLNVALTRPRCKLIVVGNGKSIYGEKGLLIHDFLEYIREEEAVYSWDYGRWITE